MDSESSAPRKRETLREMTTSLRAKVSPGVNPECPWRRNLQCWAHRLASAVYALASSPSLRGIDESGWLPAIVIPVIYREGQAPRYGAEGPGSLIAIIESYLSVIPRASARPGGAAKLGPGWRSKIGHRFMAARAIESVLDSIGDSGSRALLQAHFLAIADPHAKVSVLIGNGYQHQEVQRVQQAAMLELVRLVNARWGGIRLTWFS